MLAGYEEWDGNVQQDPMVGKVIIEQYFYFVKGQFFGFFTNRDGQDLQDQKLG